MLFLVCSGSVLVSLLKTARNAAHFLFGLLGRTGVRLFGFVLSLGFFNCIIYRETSVIPHSQDGRFVFGPKPLYYLYTFDKC